MSCRTTTAVHSTFDRQGPAIPSAASAASAAPAEAPSAQQQQLHALHAELCAVAVQSLLGAVLHTPAQPGPGQLRLVLAALSCTQSPSAECYIHSMSLLVRLVPANIRITTGACDGRACATKWLCPDASTHTVLVKMHTVHTMHAENVTCASIQCFECALTAC